MSGVLREITLHGIAQRELGIVVRWEHDMSKLQAHDITTRQGDDLRVIVEMLDQAGAPMDVQDVQDIRWAVAREVGEPIVLRKSLNGSTISLGGGNVFFFDLSPADTEDLTHGRYRHEAEIVTEQGRVYTVLSGSLHLQRQLVRDAP